MLKRFLPFFHLKLSHYSIFIFRRNMKAFLKVKPPLLLSWLTTYDIDVGAMAVEIEHFNQQVINLFYLVRQKPSGCLAK